MFLEIAATNANLKKKQICGKNVNLGSEIIDLEKSLSNKFYIFAPFHKLSLATPLFTVLHADYRHVRPSKLLSTKGNKFVKLSRKATWIFLSDENVYCDLTMQQILTVML